MATPRRIATVTLLVAGLIAARDAGAAGVWVSLGALTGATQADAALGDYRWDLSPHAGLGAQALAGVGRLGAGARVWRSSTTQSLGVAGASDASVRSTSLELVGRARLATWWGVHLDAQASGGWLHLGYAPDQVTFDPGGGPVTVAFAPIDEWIAGAGLAARRPLAGPWVAGIELERRAFGLETAHRHGSVIETARESFGDWSARLELAWLHGRH